MLISSESEDIAAETRLHIYWVLGHKGIPRNAIADEIVKFPKKLTDGYLKAFYSHDFEKTAGRLLA